MPHKLFFHLLKRPLSSTKVPGGPARHCANCSGEAGGQKRQPLKWKIFLWGCPQWNKTTKVFHRAGRWRISKLWVHSKISSQNWRSDLVQIWLLWLSEATGIVNYFEDFTIEQQPKMAW